MFPPRFASDPLCVAGKPSRHGVNKAHLEIEGWLIALDPDLPEPLQDCADILVLELDGSVGSVLQQGKERTPIGRLLVPTPRDFLRQHREIAGDGQVIFGIAPGIARHRNSSADSRPVTCTTGSTSLRLRSTRRGEFKQTTSDLTGPQPSLKRGTGGARCFSAVVEGPVTP